MRQAYDYWQDQPGKRRSFLFAKGCLHLLKSNYSTEAVDDGKTTVTTRERTTYLSVERGVLVASLFPPWPKGQCLAPLADGRGPSRAEEYSTQMRTHHRNVEKIKRLPQRRHRTKNRGLPSGNPGRNCIYKLTPPYPGESHSTELQGNAPLWNVCFRKAQNARVDLPAQSRPGERASEP